MSREAMKLALEALGQCRYRSLLVDKIVDPAVTALREALAEQPAQQEPVAWKLVPKEPTHEMLKAMDECSTEGYDERLYAGHASSVYMAAVDAAPTPPAQQEPVQNNPLDCNVYLGSGKDHAIKHHVSYGPAQRTWVGLTDEEKSDIWCVVTNRDFVTEDTHVYADAIEAKLKEKNI